MFKFELAKEILGWNTMTKEARIDTLKTRIRAGITKLNNAWEQIVVIDDPSEKEATLNKWMEARNKLDVMCDLLKLQGFNGCLFAGKDGKPMIDCGNYLKIGCLVCPSSYPFWEESLFGQRKKSENYHLG